MPETPGEIDAPSLITTAEELEQLPLGTILVDSEGDPWCRYTIGWHVCGFADAYQSAELLREAQSFRVLLRPDGSAS